MNTKTVIASYVVELTENANGSLSITATQLGQSEVSYALHATAMLSGTLGTIQKLLKELPTTSGSRLRYRC